MQFVRNGPDIPERLLQAHEDGRVVFFCGAGISYPAGLPGFAGLVDRLFSELGVTPTSIQKTAIKAGHYDTAIGLLESDHIGKREVVRQVIAKILTPNLDTKNAMATHEALLTLARARSGHVRLVTTNFDRIFEELISTKKMAITRYGAPLLPIPKARWDGVVYLHGVFSELLSQNELDRLVLSSGDFGLAYLTERWAARFVSELFRNFSLCFVGYSINDPVLRYMMDALAADRLLGESPPEMFALGSYSKRSYEARYNEWKSKNVTPILYAEHLHHAYLHKTLEAWAATYRDGVIGKERIVTECAMTRPTRSTSQDDTTGRLLWALSEPSGLPAKHFANFDPAPPLDWLEPMGQSRYGHQDLIRFGVAASNGDENKLAFSIITRPSPYQRAPWMTLVNSGPTASEWDDVMHHIAEWLMRYLDDPDLLLWVANSGGHLHHRFAWMIANRLDEIADLERANNCDELDLLQRKSPRGIPRPTLRRLWRLVLSGRLTSSRHNFSLHSWIDQAKSDGFSGSSKPGLRRALEPRITLRSTMQARQSSPTRFRSNKLSDIIDWELVLASKYVHSTLRQISENTDWNLVLPDFLLDFTVLLRDALDIMCDLGSSDDRNDLSMWHQASIGAHPQNNDFHDWTALIELARDAWVASAEGSTQQARSIAEMWWTIPYPLFKRLSFFASANMDAIPPSQSIEWLLSDHSWWLWSPHTLREVCRLLLVLAPKLNSLEYGELEQAALAGPPRSMYREGLEPEVWKRISEREIWLRLSKIKSSGRVLGGMAEVKLSEFAALHPDLKLEPDQREEFSHWIGSGDELRKFSNLPRRRRDIVALLQEHHSDNWLDQDDWNQRCRDDFATTAAALCELARQDTWPEERWQNALQSWSDERLIGRSWRYISRLLITAPSGVVSKIAHSMSWWLQAAAKSLKEHEDRFLTLCQRILDGSYQDSIDSDDPVFRSINHPIGQVTEALLRWWYRNPINDGEGMHAKLRPILTKICDPAAGALRHGRVLLAAHAITLFRVDPEWTEQYLLPLFDWRRSESQAREAWEGYLWSPRLYRPLISTIKEPFLGTALQYNMLGRHSENYASLLTYAALELLDIFKTAELSEAIGKLPPEGLRTAARALANAVEGAGDQRADYWENRASRFLRSVWPKSKDKMSESIAENFGRLCIVAGEKFPEAVNELRPWLQRPDDPEYTVRLLRESGLCSKYPEISLDFLYLTVDDHDLRPSTALQSCLNEIESKKPNMASDYRFQRLRTLLRRHSPG